jgi:hypothetical protein
MTDNPSGTAAENSTAEPTANSNFAVLAAIADLGDRATPAAIAQQVGIAYSTVNPKLRAWEAAGLAERFRPESGQTLWRLTDAGRASTATPPQFADAATPPEPATADTTADDAAEPVMPTHGATAAASPQPVTADSGEIPGDEADEAATSVAAPAPADSDTASHEPLAAAAGGGADAGEQPGGDNAAASPAGDTTRADHPGTESAPATPAPVETAEPDRDQHAGTGTTTGTSPAKRKRPKGALQASALAILQANPGSEYKVDDMRKLIDQADAGTGYARASHGAVANALDSLERDGKAAKVDDRKAATFTLAPTAG